MIDMRQCLAAISLTSILGLLLITGTPSLLRTGKNLQLKDYVWENSIVQLATGRKGKMLEIRLEDLSKTSSSSRASRAEVIQLLSQVSREFEPWKDGVSLNMVERVYCIEGSSSTMRIQIIGGKPFVVGPEETYQTRNLALLRQIMNLATRYELPDVDFMISTTDECRDFRQLPKSIDGNFTRCERNAPLFTFSRRTHETACARVPDFAWGGWPEAWMPDWPQTRLWMLMAAERMPFQNRTGKIVWRGADTHPQRKIMAESQLVQGSGLADVRLLTWGPQDFEAFKAEFKSLPEHCHNKYLLHLRGYGWAIRLRALLLCNSPVVFPLDKDEEPSEFWYHMLKDRENILLTEHVNDGNQGANVMDLVKEMESNQTLAEAIGKQGQYLAAEILHPNNIDKYWIEILSQYNRLMTFQPKVHADARPLEIALMGPEKTIHSAKRTCNVC